MRWYDAFCSWLDRVLFGLWRAVAFVLFGAWFIGWLPGPDPSTWDIILASGVWLVGNLVQHVHD